MSFSMFPVRYRGACYNASKHGFSCRDDAESSGGLHRVIHEKYAGTTELPSREWIVQGLTEARVEQAAESLSYVERKLLLCEDY
jgi:hypothetical protein